MIFQNFGSIVCLHNRLAFIKMGARNKIDIFMHFMLDGRIPSV